jgi:hypothetical protein
MSSSAPAHNIAEALRAIEGPSELNTLATRCVAAATNSPEGALLILTGTALLSIARRLDGPVDELEWLQVREVLVRLADLIIEAPSNERFQAFAGAWLSTLEPRVLN